MVITLLISLITKVIYFYCFKKINKYKDSKNSPEVPVPKTATVNVLLTNPSDLYVCIH